MTPNQVGFALLILGVFLLIGKYLRVKVKWLQNLFVPSSIIGGFIALLLGPQILGKLLTPIVGEKSFFSEGIVPYALIDVWKTLPGLMINLHFSIKSALLSTIFFKNNVCVLNIHKYSHLMSK